MPEASWEPRGGTNQPWRARKASRRRQHFRGLKDESGQAQWGRRRSRTYKEGPSGRNSISKSQRGGRAWEFCVKAKSSAQSREFMWKRRKGGAWIPKGSCGPMKDSNLLLEGSFVRLPDLANTNTGCPVNFELQINNE